MGGCCGRFARADTELSDVAPGYGRSSRTLAHQQKTWEATGVVSLRDSKLKELPKGLENFADRVRVVDVSNNSLDSLPASLTPLVGIERVIAVNNNISRIVCDMSGWSKLKVLDISSNALTAFPEQVTHCSALESLKLSNNSIASISPALGGCTKLKELHLSGNAIEAVPPEVGSCASLELIDVCSNKVSELPPELGTLSKLRRLLLNNNHQLAAVPREILTQCTLLHTLELHGTKVTREILQQTDGYESFEKRRQNKFSKAIGGNAMMRAGGVDEGVDVQLK